MQMYPPGTLAQQGHSPLLRHVPRERKASRRRPVEPVSARLRGGPLPHVPRERKAPQRSRNRARITDWPDQPHARITCPMARPTAMRQTMTTSHIGNPPRDLANYTASPNCASPSVQNDGKCVYMCMLHDVPKEHRGNTNTKTHDPPFCSNERGTLGRGSFGRQQTPGSLPT
jgi:hypothetical protein